MPFNARIFAHRGLEQMKLNKPQQFSSDSVFQLTQPYEWAQTINVTSAAASSSPVADVNSGSAVNVLRIEIASPNAVRYEINPPGRSVVAGINSPLLTGNDQFVFKSGWTVSLIDASGLA